VNQHVIFVARIKTVELGSLLNALPTKAGQEFPVSKLQFYPENRIVNENI
jgi:hypothetical protein